VEFERMKSRLIRYGVCPMCGAPFDLERVRSLVLSCANPTCGAYYQPTLAENVDLPRTPGDGRSGMAKLPDRDS
jgi:hypothetical protein